jgi:hypothetical protein
LWAAKQQGCDAQALRSGPDTMTQQPLVQVFDDSRIEVRHGHGREYTRRVATGNAKHHEYSGFVDPGPTVVRRRIAP